MSKFQENIRPGFFLEVSRWWGLSNQPGVYGIFVYEDGSYIFKSVIQKPTEEITELRESGKEITLEDFDDTILDEGTLTPEELERINTFLDEKVTENSEIRMLDAGYAIAVTREGKTVKIKNNSELYSEIYDLLPFKKHRE